jgi:hypothetical protein
MVPAIKRPPADNTTDAVPTGGNPLLVGWVRVGATCGLIAGIAYAVAAALPETSPLALFAAFVFGPALAGFSAGLYHVLRAQRRTISLDLAVMAQPRCRSQRDPHVLLTAHAHPVV